MRRTLDALAYTAPEHAVSRLCELLRALLGLLRALGCEIVPVKAVPAPVEWRLWARAVLAPLGDPSDAELRSMLDALIEHGELAAEEARALVQARDEASAVSEVGHG